MLKFTGLQARNKKTAGILGISIGSAFHFSMLLVLTNSCSPVISIATHS